jgi:hypothetical protein
MLPSASSGRRCFATTDDPRRVQAMTDQHAVFPTAAPDGASGESEVLRELNREYVRSFLESDAARYDELLADDFFCIEPNGEVVDRVTFLERAKEPANMDVFHVEGVSIRILGEFAQISARTPYRTLSGREGTNIYTDCWMQRDGRWQAISAQITPVR